MSRAKRTREAARFALAAACLLLGPGPALATDEDALVTLLSPANLAEMVGNVCAAQDPPSSTRPPEPFGTVRLYAQHVKAEITESLDESTVRNVLLRAADLAKEKALGEIRRLKRATPEDEGRTLARWCESSAKPFVRDCLHSKPRRPA